MLTNLRKHIEYLRALGWTEDQIIKFEQLIKPYLETSPSTGQTVVQAKYLEQVHEGLRSQN